MIRRLFGWTLALAVGLEVMLVANGLHQYIRYSFSNPGTGVNSDKNVADITPLAALELNMSNNTVQALSWTVIALVGAAILAGFTQRARTILIGVAAASFGTMFFFDGILPYHQHDALIALGTAAIAATAVSALLEWRGIALYKRAPTATPVEREKVTT